MLLSVFSYSPGRAEFAARFRRDVEDAVPYSRKSAGG